MMWEREFDLCACCQYVSPSMSPYQVLETKANLSFSIYPSEGAAEIPAAVRTNQQPQISMQSYGAEILTALDTFINKL